MPVLNSFCCCSLKRGTIVWGILQVTLNVIALLYDIVNLATSENSDQKQNLAYYLVACIVNILTGVCLIYGGIKESKYFLLPWLIIVCIESVAVTVIVIIGAFVHPLILIFLLFIAVIWYIWICILSYYQSLLSRQSP